MPMFIAMGCRMRPDERLGQQRGAAQARETETISGCGEFEQEMVARIPACAEAELEALVAKLPQSEDLTPGPGEEEIFVLKSGPGSGEGEYCDLRPEADLQLASVR